MLEQYFGVKVPKLGCVMLDVEPLPVKQWLPAKWAYYSTNPGLKHVQGYDAVGHITLKFGLLSNANFIKPQIDAVLEGWAPAEMIRIKSIDAFDSTHPDEPYKCIIARLEQDHLREANRRLSFLPHIDTFPYDPHFTLGYVRDGYHTPAMDICRAELTANGMELLPTGLNYGRE